MDQTLTGVLMPRSLMWRSAGPFASQATLGLFTLSGMARMLPGLQTPAGANHQ